MKKGGIIAIVVVLIVLVGVGVFFILNKGEENQNLSAQNAEGSQTVGTEGNNSEASSSVNQASVDGNSSANQASANANNASETSKYNITANGVNLTPWSSFSKEQINEEATYSEIPSCAFEGVDKVYTYASYEVTTTTLNGKEVIYSTYLQDDSITTKEGVKVSDELSKVISAYGENYEKNGTEYIYKDGNVKLSFITENDVVISIQYTMVTE